MMQQAPQPKRHATCCSGALFSSCSIANPFAILRGGRRLGSNIESLPRLLFDLSISCTAGLLDPAG